MSVNDWSTTAGNNTSVGGVSIAEGMAPSGVNNAIRGMMAELKVYFDAAGTPLTAADIGVTVQGFDADLESWKAVTRASGFDTFAATPSSANLRSLLTDETGTGAAVFAGSPTIIDPIITGAILEDIFTITDAAGFEIDPSNGTLQRVVLGASRTPAATNFANGESVTLMVDDGSAFTITWTTVGVVWVGGSAPTLATSGFTIIELWKEGNVIRGAHVGNTAS